MEHNNDAVVIEPTRPLSGAVIWLHGLGADGHDFEPLVPQLGLTDQGVRFIFPHAPIRPVTLNEGNRMRAWFDLSDLSFDADWDATGVEASVNRISKLVETQSRDGLAPTQIVLAGFSQGGAIVLEYLRRDLGNLAGALALSTFHPVGAGHLSMERNRNLPDLFMAHGLADPVVPYELGLATARAFQKAGYPLTWHRYPMGHQVCSQEVSDIRTWLQARMRIDRG